MSEELRERFGDIYVDTTYQDRLTRLGFLRRKSDDAILTYHIVKFDERGIERMGRYHEEIFAGALLGETIKRSGISHVRHDSEISVIEMPAEIAKLFASAQTHCKSKLVTYTVEDLPYATIQEFYNPEFTPVA